MKPREMAFVGVRLLAVYWVLTGVTVALKMLGPWVRIWASGQPTQTDASVFWTGGGITLVAHLIAAGLLWVGASWVAGRVSGSSTVVSGAGDETGKNGIAPILFAGVGVLLVSLAVSNILWQLLNIVVLERHGASPEGLANNYASLASSGVQVLIGLALFFSADGLHRLWLRLRGAGLE